MSWLKYGLWLWPMLVACTRHVPIPRDSLVMAISAQPVTLDPRLATDATGMRLCDLMFNGLVRLGPDLQPAPDAATNWSYRNHVYTFHLRPDLRFHNGRAVTPDDIAFTFEEYRRHGPFATSLQVITEVRSETVGDHLAVHLAVKDGGDRLLSGDLRAVKILPKSETLQAGSAFGRHPLGTGAFRFKSESSDRIELDAVTAATPHLIFKVIRDDFTRYQKMLKGEVDIAQQELPPDKVLEFERFPDRFRVFRYPGLSMSYVLINLRDPALAQRDVRVALAQSIQRADLIRYKLYGQAEEATSLLTPRNPYFLPGLKNPPYDPEAARRAVLARGLLGAKLVLKTSNTPQAIDNGKVLAYQMSQSGMDVEPQSFEWSTFYADIKKGNFQLATMRWVGNVDPELYAQVFHSRERPPGRNRGSYSNPRLDQLLDRGAAASDPDTRKKIFFEAQKIVQEDLAIIPLWYDGQITVAKKSVSHYRPDQTGSYWPLITARKDSP